MLNSRAKKESLAAIVASFYEDQKRQEAFYLRFKDELSGFPGVWNFLVDASDAFIFWENRTSESGEWIEAIDDFAETLRTVKAIPDTKQLKVMAHDSLAKNGYEFDKGNTCSVCGTDTIKSSWTPCAECEFCNAPLCDDCYDRHWRECESQKS